jgi:hypothetical protein
MASRLATHTHREASTLLTLPRSQPLSHTFPLLCLWLCLTRNHMFSHPSSLDRVRHPLSRIPARIRARAMPIPVTHLKPPKHPALALYRNQPILPRITARIPILRLQHHQKRSLIQHKRRNTSTFPPPTSTQRKLRELIGPEKAVLHRIPSRGISTTHLNCHTCIKLTLANRVQMISGSLIPL